MGLGSAYIEGFNYALKRGYDKVVMMDCDLSHPPQKLPELINSDTDFTVGSRYNGFTFKEVPITFRPQAAR